MKIILQHSVLSIYLLFLLIASASAQEEKESLAQDQSSLSVTIYNQNLALVKDTRSVMLNKGLSILAIKEVSAQIRPETALIKSLSDDRHFTVLEQNFDFDLLTPQKLLEKYVGKTVDIISTNPSSGVESQEKATVLSANNGVVLKIGQRIESGVHGRIVYPDIPENLRDKPTLVTTIQNDGLQKHSLELNYLTGGLGWKADYVAELDQKDQFIDLSGWVTLTNTSGTAYNNAQLQLVAGDVNRVHETLRPMVKSMRMEAVADAASPMQEESLFEYHLYTLDRKTSLLNNQTKQVALLSSSAIPVKKELVLQGADYYYQGQYGEIGKQLKVDTFLRFKNEKAHQLGIPLPKGIIRVYKRDQAGSAQFIGEDTIDHTPNNETVNIRLGASFDVTADKKQTDFKILQTNAKRLPVYESAYEIRLKNAKKEPILVTVREPIAGDWKILTENKPHTKDASNLVSWQLSIPPEGETILQYRVQTKL